MIDSLLIVLQFQGRDLVHKYDLQRLVNATTSWKNFHIKYLMSLSTSNKCKHELEKVPQTLEVFFLVLVK